MPYPIDILAATYGGVDVTNKVRKIYADSTASSNILNVTADDNVFGFDPWEGNWKSLTVVYRTRVPDPNNQNNFVFSQALQASCQQTSSIGINIQDSNLPPVQTAVTPNNLYILNAMYATRDVTSIVRNLVSNNSLSFTVDDGTLGGDPWNGVWKSLTVTYGYVDRYGEIPIQVKAARQTAVLSITPPPKPLVILGADCASVDVKDQLTKLINPVDQTLTFIPNTIISSAFWGATIAILYQYGDDPIQLVIRNAEDGYDFTIKPGTTEFHTKYLNPAPQQAGVTNILSATWGNMSNAPTGASMSWYSKIANCMSVTPSTAFFGFDPWVAVKKTAVVFFKYGLSGQIHRGSFIQDDKPCPLEERVSLVDPLPARGFLAATPASSKFYLMGANNKYVRYDAPSNTLYADQLVNTSATPFTTVAGTHKLSFQNANATRFVSVDSNSALTTVTDGTNAAEFNYELVQSGTTATLSLNLNKPGSTNQSIPLLMSIATTGGSLYANGQLTVVTAYQSTSALEYSFQVEWIKNAQLDKSVQELALQGIDLGDACTWAWFTVLKDLTYGFLTTVAGLPLARIDSTNRIIQWYSSLQAAGKAIVDAQMAAAKTAWALAKTNAQTIAFSASMIGNLYVSGLLWDLIKFIIPYDTWWGIIKTIGQVCVVIASWLLPGTQELQIIKYSIGIASFVVQLGIDFVAATKACTPATTPIQQERLAKTHNMIIKAIQQEGSTFGDMALKQLMHLIFLFYLNTGALLFGDQEKVPSHMQAPLSTLQQQVGMLMLTL